MTLPRLELLVEGETLQGFESGAITASIDAFASTFEVEYDSEKVEGGGRLIVEAGDAVELRVDDQAILSGFVDIDETTEGAKVDRKLTGRSKLGDLVDCSSFHSARRFRDASILDIAKALSEPYGIDIVDETEAIEPFDRWTLKEGSTVADELMRAAKARGVVLLDRGGALVLAKAGADSTRTVLTDESTIGEPRRIRDHTGRFSEYVVKSKRRRRDEDTGGLTKIRYKIEDEGMRRFRRKVVNGYGDAEESPRLRAILERNVRAGRSETLIYEVPGWLTDEGTLWRPNMRVDVRDPRFDVDATMIVVRSTLQHGTKLHRTELELTRPQAFDAVVEYPARRRGEGLR